MIQRTISGSSSGLPSSSSKMWSRFLNPSRKGHKDDGRGKTNKVRKAGSRETFNTDFDSTSTLHENPESNHRQLQSLIQRMRAAPSGPKEVDTAYQEFKRIKNQCAALCNALLQGEFRATRTLSNSTEAFSPRRDSSFESPRSPGGGLFDQRSSFSGRSLAEVASSTGIHTRSTHVSEASLAAIRDWKHCIEILVDAFYNSLLETFKSYERDATPETIETFFTNKKYRKDAITRMRNMSVTRVMSADPEYFPRYAIRFYNYERVKDELRHIRGILHAAESGISPLRHVEEITISERGDAALEFANNSPDAMGNEPVLRFRVSSLRLSDTSPIFARMFSGTTRSLEIHEDEDISPHLPPQPTAYTWKDGGKLRLFRMPQHELNREDSLTILLHAAHLHAELIPEEITFAQLVAIAECSLRYRCSSPLEAVVEHTWLPQWMHKGADESPDGLVVISYAFGVRELFTRMSKTVILDLVDDKDLFSKPWTPRLKDKIWAIRCAKVAQVHACCASTIQEYIRPSTAPATHDQEPLRSPELGNSHFSPLASPKNATTITSAPRCPKGSHACDATNLGWMMVVFNELGLLPLIMRSDALSHLPGNSLPSRSLSQLLEALIRIPSPPEPIHRGGVCDPAPSFRAALNDIFNSVTGLTLHDVSGKSHGWALSKHRINEPEALQMHGIQRMAPSNDSYSVIHEFPDEVRLRILFKMDNLKDLEATAMTSRAFYNTYKEKELVLIRNILRVGPGAGSGHNVRLTGGNTEADKFRKEDSDLLKESSLQQEELDAQTLRSDDELEDLSSEEDEMPSISNTPAPSIYEASLLPSRSRAYERRRLPESEDVEQDEAVLVNALQSPAGSPTPPSTATQARPRSPAKPADQFIEHVDEVVPMTREEAERILWPDAAIAVSNDVPTQATPPGAEGLREKFLGGDPAFVKTPEEKTLMVRENEKQLTSEMHERVGLLKGDRRKDGRPESSSSKG